MVSPAKKASNKKWDQKNMKSVGVKLKLTEAEAFRDYAAERGTTVNALIAGYVRRCLAEDAASKRLE